MPRDRHRHAKVRLDRGGDLRIQRDAPEKPDRRGELAPLEKSIEDAAGNSLAEPRAHRVQRVAFLHCVDDIGLCEDGAPRRDARRRSGERGRPAGKLLDAQTQAIRLLLEERARAGGARGVGGVLAVPALIVEEDQGKGLPADEDDVAAFGKHAPGAFHRCQHAVDDAQGAQICEAPRDPDCVRAIEAGGCQEIPERGLDLPPVLLVGRVEDIAVLQHDRREIQ